MYAESLKKKVRSVEVVTPHLKEKLLTPLGDPPGEIFFPIYTTIIILLRKSNRINGVNGVAEITVVYR